MDGKEGTPSQERMNAADLAADGQKPLAVSASSLPRFGGASMTTRPMFEGWCSVR